MGTALHSSRTPVEKTTLCIIARSDAAEFSQREPFSSRSSLVMPCIRCGACADACPLKLLPQQIFWHAQAKEIEKTNDFHVLDCIECGCCDYVCPSHIPLVQYFRYAKAGIKTLDKEKAQSNIARQRHEFRLQRLERNKNERAERHKKKIDELTKKSPLQLKTQITETVEQGPVIMPFLLKNQTKNTIERVADRNAPPSTKH